MRKPNQNRTERIGEFEVRYQGGEIDEIVGPHFHLEFMADNQVWIGMGKGVKCRGGRHPSIMVNFGAKGEIWMMAESNECFI